MFLAPFRAKFQSTPWHMPTMRHTSLGLSLVELLVSLAVGLTIMAGVTGVYINSIRSSSDTLKITRLNQELRSVMDIMVRDIRRAGYRGRVENIMFSTPTSANPFTLSVIGDCITYEYDINGNGTVDDASVNTDERFGFRYNNNEKAVERRRSGGDCDDSGWWKFTDEEMIEITSLTFTPNSSPVSVGANISTSTITVNSLKIQLTGRVKDDATIPQRTLTDTVRMRSDVYTP